MRSNKFFLFAFVLGIILSCKKSETTTTPSNAQLLAGTTSKSWRISTAIATYQGLQVDLLTVPNFGLNQQCVQDNQLVLSANNTYQITEGASKCNSTDPSTITSGNYTLSSDGKTLHIDKIVFGALQQSNIDMTVNQLSASNLNVQTTVVYQGTTYNVTLAFVPA